MTAELVKKRGPRAGARSTPESRAHTLKIRAAQFGILAVLLLAWEFIPQIPGLQDKAKVFDPFFVSSPSRVFIELGDMATGRGGQFSIWDYAWPTLFASLLGTVIGMVLGAVCGLLLSNFKSLSEVLRPYLIAANATPRVALIPIVVIIFGPSLSSSVIIAVLVVFFVAFFNAYEGGTTVKPELVENARLLGANERNVVTAIRWPFVMAWTLASLPLAVTFAVITVVTAEILTGYNGMGKLLSTASTNADSSLTYAVVITLSIMGVVVVVGADVIRARVLHWWGK